MDTNERKRKIIEAGRIAVDQLIKVAKEDIKGDEGGDLSAEKMKNAAASKKLAIFDAFDIMERIKDEEDKIKLEEEEVGKDRSHKGFAEDRAGR